MSEKPIDLEDERRARLPGYLAIERFDAAILEVLAVADEIEAQEGKDAPSVRELRAYAVLLRRAAMSTSERSASTSRPRSG